MQTEPPPRYKYADTVNQSVIYDAYVKYEEMKEAQDADDQKGAPGKQQKETNAAIKRLLAEKTVDKNQKLSRGWEVLRVYKIGEFYCYEFLNFN